MSKFCGVVGFVKSYEVEDGVWDKKTIERVYRGNTLTQRIAPSTNTYNNISNINLRHKISVVMDGFLNDEFDNIAYVVYKNKKWRVTDVEISHPRVFLNLGGLYNG